MFEHRQQNPLPRSQFYLRVFIHGLMALSIIFGSLGIGILGYRLTEGFSWLDSLLNAAMILGGMGPVNEIHTTWGKLFASFYSLFSGIVFLAVAGLIFAQIAHRILHRFHFAADEENN